MQNLSAPNNLPGILLQQQPIIKTKLYLFQAISFMVSAVDITRVAEDVYIQRLAPGEPCG